MLRDHKKLRLKAIDRILHHHVDTDNQPPWVRPFVAHFFANVSVADLNQLDTAHLYQLSLNMAHWLEKRTKTAIRIFNPTIQDHGWQSPHTVIEIMASDRPFLIDSLSEALSCLGYRTHLLIHPVVTVTRTADGTLTNLSTQNGSSDQATDCLIHVQIDYTTDQSQLDTLLAEIHRVMDHVKKAVNDWQAMLSVADKAAHELSAYDFLPDQDRHEAIDFLRWLKNHHFTFLGYRYCTYAQKDGHTVADFHNGLGVLQESDAVVFSRMSDGGVVPAEISSYLERREPILINKSNTRSFVHRSAYMDVVSVKCYTPTGDIIGEHRFVGLFTSRAYHENPHHIPILRQKVLAVKRDMNFGSHSHDGKSLVHVLNTFPREELFQITQSELANYLTGILQLKNKQSVSLFVRQDGFERFFACLVYVPKDRFNTALRIRIQAILEKAFRGEVIAYQTRLSEEALARLYLVVKTTPGHIPDFNIAKIEALCHQTARTWADRFEDALHDRLRRTDAYRFLSLYKDVFPANYCDIFTEKDALKDLPYLEKLSVTNPFASCLYVDKKEQLCLKVYHYKKAIPLSNLLPLLKNMGFHMLTEIPFCLETPTPIWIHHCTLSFEGDLALNHLQPAIERALHGIHHHYFENDSLNTLVASKGMWPENLVILRTYSAYLKQTNAPYGPDYIHPILVQYGDLACLLIKFFYALFEPQAGISDTTETHEPIEDPSGTYNDNRKGLWLLDTVDDIHAQINSTLSAIENVEHERVLRSLYSVIKATKRTNFFHTNWCPVQIEPADDKTDKLVKHIHNGAQSAYHNAPQQSTDDPTVHPLANGMLTPLAIKLSSPDLNMIPDPKPVYEIYMYAARMEAIHLRGGTVARGGLRWSDRPEDFRFEIFDLVKAQTLKNAVIVPAGSKGGFVVKTQNLYADRTAFMTEVKACYTWMIESLLSITDNITQGNVTPPAHLVRLDGDDPYLVVAADKGTATFSDMANAISQKHGFWLDDAFASGGSNGYDHKKMGITAKGAWESVKRHFRGLGIDCQQTSFTAVGVGDMSGDVFGNGMLLSQHTQLVGAFNHLEIFVDPTPNCAASYTERQRLFNLPRSKWSDYDKNALSKGGRIYSRKTKKLDLTPQIQSLLGLPTDTTTLSPNQLIRALLTLKVDLLWFGGIGTFIKDESESHTDARDKANNRLRVNAQDLKCRIMGEGANLAITQQARIGFATKGGCVYTDSIDNVGGVDCSDHEVNIKILLNQLVEADALSLTERNQYLLDMTEAVESHVLKNGRKQSQGLAIENNKRNFLLDYHGATLASLENNGRLIRTLESLPSMQEIEDRRDLQQGFCAPELCVLTSHVKNALYSHISTTDLWQHPVAKPLFLSYFPTQLQTNFMDYILNHPLRREITTTVLVNDVVDTLGSTSIHRLSTRTGHAPETIMLCFLYVRRLCGLDTLWLAIEDLGIDQLTAKDQYDLFFQLQNAYHKRIVSYLKAFDGQDYSVISRALDQTPEAFGQQQDLYAQIITTIKDHNTSTIDGTVDQNLIAKLEPHITQALDAALCTDALTIMTRYNQSQTSNLKTFIQLHRDSLTDLGIAATHQWIDSLSVSLRERDSMNKIMGHVDDLHKDFVIRIHKTTLSQTVSTDTDSTETSLWTQLWQSLAANNPSAFALYEQLRENLKQTPPHDLAGLILWHDHLSRLYKALETTALKGKKS
jgi:glutamate dehydrogenase